MHFSGARQVFSLYRKKKLARKLLNSIKITQLADFMRSILSRLIGRLTVGRKLALIYFLDLTAVIFVSGILIHEKFIAIDFAKKEIVGNQYIASVRDALMAVEPLERGAVVNAEQFTAARESLAQAVTAAETKFGRDMDTQEPSRNFVAAIRRLKVSADREDVSTDANDALGAGQMLLTRIGNQSKLILDPDLDSYYTKSLIVLRFPELLEIESSMHRLALTLAATPAAMRQGDQTRFVILEGRIDALLKGITSDYIEAFSASTPALKQRLQRSQSALLLATAQFRTADLLPKISTALN